MTARFEVASWERSNRAVIDRPYSNGGYRNVTSKDAPSWLWNFTVPLDDWPALTTSRGDFNGSAKLIRNDPRENLARERTKDRFQQSANLGRAAM